ncbi:MAG: DUF4956 domain-containing protein [Oligoflexia bacterium]|nr:DUF4956 domain-containing protein [Oligoflexia bacterium]
MKSINNLSDSQNLSFLTEHVTSDDIWIHFATSVCLAFVLSYILKLVYLKYSSPDSDQKKFADLFQILTITTLMVVMIIHSSITLSLGLVGALSIVRFRTPIKSAEDLLYFFICIAIAIGLAAFGYYVVISCFIIIISILILNQRKKFIFQEKILLSIEFPLSIEKEYLVQIFNSIKPISTTFKIKRIEKNHENMEVIIAGKIENTRIIDLNKILNDQYPKASFSIIE